MSQIKPSTHGIVVDHKESGVRYAVSDRNYNSKVHTKVRDLKAGETVLGFKPLSRSALGKATEQESTEDQLDFEALDLEKTTHPVVEAGKTTTKSDTK